MYYYSDFGREQIDPRSIASRINILGLLLLVAPTEEPVTLDEARLFAKIDDDVTEDNDLIVEMIKAARIEAESYTDSAFVSRKMRATWDYNPNYSVLEVPLSPLLSVEKVFYIDDENIEQTFDPSKYTVSITSNRRKGRIILNSGATWPTGKREYSAIGVDFTCGFGAASSVPSDIKIAIKKSINAMYENREPFAKDMPQVSKNLLFKYAEITL